MVVCVAVPVCHTACILHFAQFKNTALHLAAQGGHLNMVKFLVPDFELSVFEKNLFHKTCRNLAKAGGHRHVVEYLDSDFPTLKAKVSLSPSVWSSMDLYVWLGWVHNYILYCVYVIG